MGSQSTTGSDWVRWRLEYLARETAEEAPEISALLLALSVEPTDHASISRVASRVSATGAAETGLRDPGADSQEPQVHPSST